MKFLCQGCKAKYQIDDDKVRGRNLKMKCRKCGTIIAIAGGVGKPSADGAERAIDETPTPSSARARASRPTPLPKRGEGTPSGGGRASKPGGHRPGVIPRAVSSTSSSALRAATARQIIPLAQQPVVALSVSEERWSLAPAAETETFSVAPPREVEASGALAEALRAPIVSEIPAAAADAWYVGIGGQSEGPFGIEELRSKARADAIHSGSLVWREGFENWLPLSKFPELTALLEETHADSQVTPKAAAGRSPAAAGSTLTADLPAPVEQADPFAPKASPPMSVTFDSFGDELRGVRRKRSAMPSPAALFALVCAVGFGLTIGFVLFGGGEKTKVIREVVEVPAAPTSPPVAPPSDLKVADMEASPDEQEPTSGAQSPPSRKVAQVPPTATPSNAPPQEGLSGLSGLKGLSAGPVAGPGSGPAATGAQPLDSGQIQQTVSRYTPSVRRSCWQPALDGRDPSAPASARVNVSITVGPDGKVRSATTDGDPRGYPGLGTCIAQRVRMWTFPSSSGTTTVNVPFVFAAQ